MRKIEGGRQENADIMVGNGRRNSGGETYYLGYRSLHHPVFSAAAMLIQSLSKQKLLRWSL